MENISKHITYNEATLSGSSIKFKIDNTPTQEILDKMILVAELVFEPVRVWYNKPIKINSFYRNPVLNKLVKGAKNSQHMLGEAIDIDTGNITNNKKIFNWIKENLEFDQLIWENGGEWVHISYRLNNNRNQVLKIG